MTSQTSVADRLGVLALLLAVIAAAAGLLIPRAVPMAGMCWLALTGLSVLVIFGMNAAAGEAADLIPVAIFAVITGMSAVLAGVALTSSRPAAEA